MRANKQFENVAKLKRLSTMVTNMKYIRKEYGNKLNSRNFFLNSRKTVKMKWLYSATMSSVKIFQRLK